MSPSRAEAVAALRLFDHEETALVDRALAAISRRAPSDAVVLRGFMDRLGHLGGLLSSFPSLRSRQRLGGKERNETTVIEHLCEVDGLSGDLELPVKANLARTFLLSKIHFLRAFLTATTALEAQGEEFSGISHDLREELAQSIYTQLAEELLLALLRKPEIPTRTKRRAAAQLLTVWDNAQLEIDDFCPLLESAWHARNRITSGFGCLLGTAEYFRLVCEDCAPPFLDFFARDEVSVPERQAFEEFLFNMTYEELSGLRTAMRQQGLDTVSSDWADEVVGRNIEKLDNSGRIDPLALYRSYNRRQLAADFRIMADADGPRRTAEAYMMIYLLDQQAHADGE
jgi:hypothetical protein